jgi:acetolactate synthase-1/2/3 large subunit
MMSGPANDRTGGQVLVDQLRLHGVDTVFCVPGESYLAALDAFHDVPDDIRIIVCRHESGAAYMAEAYGKITGKPGVVFVTRGPGACNAAIALHTAFQDSTPMVVFIGQVARNQEYREAFQEIDYRQFYAPLTKWVAQIERADRIPELVSQAFHRAMAGRCGPVALSLPEDMLSERTPVDDAASYVVARPGADPHDMQSLRELLSVARSPFLLIGGGGWTPEACADIVAFADANDLPTGCSFRCQHLFDNTHKNYAGDVGIGINPKLAERIRNADLLVVVGARLGEQTTRGYTLVDIPNPRQQLIHIYPDPNELGRVYRPDLPICASVTAFAKAAGALQPVDSKAWKSAAIEARQDYLDHVVPTTGLPGDLDMAEVIAILRQRLPDVLIATDAGNFSGWVQRFHSFTRYPGQIGPANGSMGYGVPAAIAARLVNPERSVVGFCGDGGVLMTGNEVATAIRYGIDPVICIVNNNMYGTIRMHQEQVYSGREIATELSNPNFAEWARSFGAFGELVERTADFAPALDRALDAGRIAFLELRIDPEVITTQTTLSALREQASGA